MCAQTSYQIKVLQKALQILELFDEKGKALSVSEISSSLGLNKTSVFRILRNLEERGYLEKDPESMKYSLGLKLFYLGSMVEPYSNIKRIARPWLETLNERCGETVHLVVLHRGEALYLDKIEGKRTIRVISRVGMKLPAHCSGVGKVLLAYLPKEEVESIVREKGLRRFTENTITNLERLREELSAVRRQGYAIDREEIEVGLMCVAAPLRDAEGRVVAAISISGPRERFRREMGTLRDMVMGTADAISSQLQAQVQGGRSESARAGVSPRGGTLKEDQLGEAP